MSVQKASYKSDLHKRISMRKRPFQRRGDLSGIYEESLLEQTKATESILIPLSGCENVPKRAGR